MISTSPTDDGRFYYFTCATLIDITKTDIVRHYNEAMPEPKDEYELKRNQQRNWQSILQVIGLRSQPMYLSSPIVNPMDDLAVYEFGSNFTTGKVWSFHFGVEQEGIFDTPSKPGGLLLEDLHNVPIVTGLTEDVTIDPAIIDTVSPQDRNTIILK